MAQGPKKYLAVHTVPDTLTADQADIPFFWNNSGRDWVLDTTNPPTITELVARTGSGSASDGLIWVKYSLNRVSAAAAETGLASHVLKGGTTLTAQVGEPFDNLTASSNVIPSGTGVNLDFDIGASAVNTTVSKFAQVTATFLEGTGTTTS